MSSNLRIGGLATGMDIDQVVRDLMQAQRAKSDRIKQKRQQVEWRQADYRTVNNSLRTLRDVTFKMKLQGTYLSKKAASSNESAVTATAGATAAKGSYTVNVDWLAEGVTKGSQASLPEEENNSDGTVKTLATQFGISGVKTFTLEGKLVSGSPLTKTFNIDTATYTIYTMVTEINNANLGITASYDSAANRLYLTTAGTGSDYGIRVASDPDGFLSNTAGDGNNTTKLLLQTGVRASGKDAQYDFGDVNNISSKTNTFTVNGITLTLKSAGTSTVTVISDVDSVYNSIKSFIDQYNTTIDLINKELAEERYKDYLPLTDEQREQLSDKQEEDWEEKAKSGMLRNDSYLTGLAGKMRAAMNGVVSGIASVVMDGRTVTHNSLASVGIITGDYREGGKLYLKNDGADLKAAIEADPDGVMKLFNNDSTVAGRDGIAVRLYEEVNNGVNEIIEKAGAESSFSLRDDSVLGKKLYDLDKQIDNWEEKLIEIENRYWRQFTAMEKAINQLNAQSAWLAQQFGSGSNNQQ